MSSEIHKIVSLAIELIECNIKSLDTSREVVGGFRSGGYSTREWAIDVLRQLPEDREEALLIIAAHSPVEPQLDNRRRVNRLCREYYRRLGGSGIIAHGQRLLKNWG